MIFQIIIINELYGIINNIKDNIDIYNYNNHKKHLFQYIINDYETKEVLNTNDKYHLLEFNIKKYNYIIYDKLFNLYSNNIIELKNKLKEYILLDLSTLFLDDLQIIYTNKNFFNYY